MRCVSAVSTIHPGSLQLADREAPNIGGLATMRLGKFASNDNVLLAGFSQLARPGRFPPSRSAFRGGRNTRKSDVFVPRCSTLTQED